MGKLTDVVVKYEVVSLNFPRLKLINGDVGIVRVDSVSLSTANVEVARLVVRPAAACGATGAR